jgi:hypothetical protein
MDYDQNMSYTELAKNFHRHGFCIVPNVFSRNEILNMRRDLERLFDSRVGDDLTSLKWNELPDHNLESNLISKMFFDGRVRDLLTSIFSSQQAMLFPVIQLHKNYLPHSQRQSWHCDAGSERIQTTTRHSLSSGEYMFGHVGIYFQENGPFGGSIDVVPYSHTGLRSGNIFLTKAIDYFIECISRFPRITYVLKKLLVRKVEIELGDVVLFDWRVFHRGSPAFRKMEKEIEYSTSSFHAKLPKLHSKLSLYCQFGSALGMDTHLDSVEVSESRLYSIFLNQLKQMNPDSTVGYPPSRSM